MKPYQPARQDFDDLAEALAGGHQVGGERVRHDDSGLRQL